jgi:hypothetical protein
MTPFRQLLSALLSLAMLAGCAASAPASARWTLSVSPPDSVAERAARTSMEDADLLIASFAFSNGFGDVYTRGLAREVKVFTAKPEFDRYLQASGEWPRTTAVPETVVAIFGTGALLATAEAEARRTNPAIDSHDAYVRILMHELAHGLHLAVVGGDKTALGPRWFFEGFAVAAAEQFDGPEISAADYRAVVAGSPMADYRLFGAAVRKLLRTHSYSALIEQARKPTFNAWALAAAKFT